MSDPEPYRPPARLVELLRELGRTERLEGYERDALRRAAAELERLQPGNLHTRSEYRAIHNGVGATSPTFATRPLLRQWLARTGAEDVTVQHRTVVESEWRPVR